ncbi:MAG: ferritin family protein [Halanaerobiaceae bacterium]
MLDSSFNAVEVLEMAKDIEKNGRDFYKKYANKTGDHEFKQLLEKLAADEEDHYQTFDQLSKQVKEETGDKVNYVYDPEVSAYLDALVEFTVFPPDLSLDLEDYDEIITRAIRAEKDSILLYQEMLASNRGEKTRNVLTRLIAEEKQHLLDLLKYNAEKK